MCRASVRRIASIRRSLAPLGLGRQRRRGEADVPVPRNVPRGATAAHDRFVERGGAWADLVRGARFVRDMDDTAIIGIVGPVGCTRRPPLRAALKARPIIPPPPGDRQTPIAG